MTPTMLILIILAASSIVLNILLVSFCTRTMHWANYWKAQYRDAVNEIDPIDVDPYRAIREQYNWKEDWD